MADDEGKKNDLQYYSNQPYDMEVKLSDNEDEEKDDIKQDINDKPLDNAQEEDEDQPNYQEVKVESTIKPLPKFDISKFQEILSKMLGDGVLTVEKYADILQHFVDKNEVNFNFDDAYKQEIKNNMAEEMENIDLEEEDEEENPDEVELKENGFAKPKDSLFKKLFKKKR